MDNNLFDIKRYYDTTFLQHLEVLNNTEKEIFKTFAGIVAHCVEAVRKDKKLLFFGNGGSASDAQHIATELVVRFNHKNSSKLCFGVSIVFVTFVIPACPESFLKKDSGQAGMTDLIPRSSAAG